MARVQRVSGSIVQIEEELHFRQEPVYLDYFYRTFGIRNDSATIRSTSKQ